MKKYEFIFLTHPDFEKDQLEKIFSVLEKEFKKIGGKVTEKEDWGRKELAYPVKKQNRAYFWIWHLDFKGEVDINPINLFLSRESGVIRYLILGKRKRDAFILKEKKRKGR